MSLDSTSGTREGEILDFLAGDETPEQISSFLSTLQPGTPITLILKPCSDPLKVTFDGIVADGKIRFDDSQFVFPLNVLNIFGDQDELFVSVKTTHTTDTGATAGDNHLREMVAGMLADSGLCGDDDVAAA